MSSAHDSAEANRNAVVLAILIIAALATAIGVFLMRAPGRAIAAHHDRVKAQPARSARIPVRSRPELVRGAQNRDRLNPRQEYAISINRRLRAKGRTCRIRAAGELGRVLEISWTKKDLDKEHMEKLKVAQGFFETLKGLVFSRIEMKVDGKLVWFKDL